MKTKSRFPGLDNILIESWKLMWTQPIVFLPLALTFLFQLVIDSATSTFFPEPGDGALLFSNPRMIFLGVGMVLVTLLIAIYFMGLQVSVFGRVSRKKPVTLSSALRLKETTYGKVFKLFLVKLVIFIPVIIAFIILATLLVIASLSETLILILMVVLGLLAVIVLAAWLLFAEPILAENKYVTWDIIKRCTKLFKEDKKHVWGTLGIIIGTSLVISLALNLLMILAVGLGSAFLIPLGILYFILQIIVSTWVMLFLYKAYATRYW